MFQRETLNVSYRCTKPFRYMLQSEVYDSTHLAFRPDTPSCVSNVLWKHWVHQRKLDSFGVSTSTRNTYCVTLTHYHHSQLRIFLFHHQTWYYYYYIAYGRGCYKDVAESMLYVCCEYFLFNYCVLFLVERACNCLRSIWISFFMWFLFPKTVLWYCCVMAGLSIWLNYGEFFRQTLFK